MRFRKKLNENETNDYLNGKINPSSSLYELQISNHYRFTHLTLSFLRNKAMFSALSPSYRVIQKFYQACEAGVVSGGAKLTKSCSLTAMESYMAGPISVKLSGIDEGYRAQHLEQKKFESVNIDFSSLWLALYWSAGAGGAREIEKQNEMCGAAQIKNELRS